MSATTATASEPSRYRQRIRGWTELSQRGRTWCTPIISTQAIGINVAMPRLVASMPEGRWKANASRK